VPHRRNQRGRPILPLARCVNATREQLAELNQALTAGQARHRANPVMVSRLQTLDAELQPLRARLGRETRGLPECEQLSQTLAAEHERLARIAGPDPQVADCMTANAQVLREALQALDTAAKAAPARPTQAAQAQVALKRLDDLRPVLARESQNLAACRQLSSQPGAGEAAGQRAAIGGHVGRPDGRECRAGGLSGGRRGQPTPTPARPGATRPFWLA
jgi:hypothetical protein